MLIPHSSAIVKGIAEGTIEWETDPDFGYQVAAQRARHRRRPTSTCCSRGGSTRRPAAADEYAERVAQLKAERAEFLAQFPSLSAEIVASVS